MIQICTETLGRCCHLPARIGTQYILLTLVVLLTQAFVAYASNPLPEGEILYYEETRQGKGNLMILDLRSGEKKQVGRSGSRPDHFPGWSPDGQRIVFESYRKGGWHIWTADAAGKNARRLSNLPDFNTRYYEFDPAFSNNSQTVVFTQGDDLWTVSLNEPAPKRLTPENNGLWETAASWSPDGEALVMVGYGDADESWNLYIMLIADKSFTQLTNGQGTNLAPRWSPDGKHILFYSDRSASFELYEMTSDGKNTRPVLSKTQLNSAGFKKTPLVHPWDNNWGATEQYRADYSPDGNWIAFSRDIDGDRELFISQRDGSKLQRLTNRPGLDGQPAWRPTH